MKQLNILRLELQNENTTLSSGYYIFDVVTNEFYSTSKLLSWTTKYVSKQIIQIWDDQYVRAKSSTLYDSEVHPFCKLKPPYMGVHVRIITFEKKSNLFMNSSSVVDWKINSALKTILIVQILGKVQYILYVLQICTQ